MMMHISGRVEEVYSFEQFEEPSRFLSVLNAKK